MLPNIDPAANAAAVSAAPAVSQVKRTDQSAVPQAYSSPAPADSPVIPGAPALDSAPYQGLRSPAEQTQIPGVGQRDGAVETQRTAGDAARTTGAAKPKTGSYLRQQADQAEINFQMTREEREAFLNAMSGKEDPSEMTEREQSALQRASERIEKLIEDAATRQTDRGDRLDKAIKEWYSRLANGKYDSPPNLLQLIQQAAAGNMNFKDIGRLAAN